MGQRRDVVPAQQNPARRRCQGAVEQPGDGRLARSAGADERYPLAGFDGEAEIRQRIARGVRIARADVVDDDPVATARQIGGPGPVDDLGFVEEFTDALDAGARGEQGGQQVAEITDRAIAASEQGEEGQHPAEGQSVGGQRPYPRPITARIPMSSSRSTSGRKSARTRLPVSSALMIARFCRS